MSTSSSSSSSSNSLSPPSSIVLKKHNKFKLQQLLPPEYDPEPTDILCGRGNVHGHHHGNRFFEQLVLGSLKKYKDAPTRPEKIVVVDKLLTLLRAGGYRFIKLQPSTKTPSAKKQWYILDDVEAHIKVGHAIRDTIRLKGKQSRAVKLLNGKRKIPLPLREQHAARLQLNRSQQQKDGDDDDDDVMVVVPDATKSSNSSANDDDMQMEVTTTTNDNDHDHRLRKLTLKRRMIKTADAERRAMKAMADADVDDDSDARRFRRLEEQLSRIQQSPSRSNPSQLPSPLPSPPSRASTLQRQPQQQQQPQNATQYPHDVPEEQHIIDALVAQNMSLKKKLYQETKHTTTQQAQIDALLVQTMTLKEKLQHEISTTSTNTASTQQDRQQLNALIKQNKNLCETVENLTTTVNQMKGSFELLLGYIVKANKVVSDDDDEDNGTATHSAIANRVQHIEGVEGELVI